MVTVSATVPAVADSLGTRKVSLAKLPAATSDGLTLTCAAAMPAPASRPTAVRERTAMPRRHRGARELVVMVVLRNWRWGGLAPREESRGAESRAAESRTAESRAADRSAAVRSTAPQDQQGSRRMESALPKW